MPFNVAEFNAAVSKAGIAQTSHFEGWILAGPGSHPRAAGGTPPDRKSTRLNSSH